MKTIKRDKYLNELIQKKNNSLIKIITGIRRAGKSFLLFTLFKSHLIESGVQLDHIICISFDEEKNQYLCNRSNLYKYLNTVIKDNDQYYFLLDEIQNVDRFEPILIEFSRKPNVDIYVTGSNSKFLSADIDTALNGKNDCIHLFPLSFSEFTQCYDNDINRAWKDFIMYGSLPLITIQNTQHNKIKYLQQIYSELYLNDLLIRHKIRHKTELQQISRIISSSIGSFTNPLNISHTFKSEEKINIHSSTVKNYLNALESSFLINAAQKYDIRGRKIIGANTKYYFEDVGLRNAANNFKNLEITHILENIVFNELKYRNFNVSVGCINLIQNINGKRQRTTKEIDFVATLGYKKFYIQVTTTLSLPEVYKRETSTFKYANNASRKILITTDNVPIHENEDGILIINIFDFLLNQDILN